MSFWTSYLQAAEAGQPVWLGDLKASAASAAEAAPLVLRLTGLDGTQADFPLSLPPWEGEAERAFAQDLLCASVFNLLSARGGRGLTLCFDTRNAALGALVGALPGVFQLNDARRGGLGKAISVSNRITGGRFAFSTLDIRDFAPLPPPPAPARENLAGRLLAAAERASRGLCAGLDVGGTDVKLAVARGGELLLTRDFDWDPALSPTAAGLIDPMLTLLEDTLRDCGAAGFDAIGLSFPDVVIADRICGGETPKTRGIRDNPALDYEEEFAKISALGERLRVLCVPGGRVHLTNDGNMAAFTAAVELAFSGAALEGGVLAHSLGTDLGSGWLRPDGRIPAIPLEAYDFLFDLGSRPQRAWPAADLRSVCNENSGLPGARRYLGQAACFRMAQELEPSLLAGFAIEADAALMIPSEQRKPCLEHLMAEAERGDAAAEEIFRRVGGHLGQVSREIGALLRPETKERYLYGRFVKRERCFALIREGCAAVLPELLLIAADENLARSPLMRQLAARDGAAVAAFGQAVGAITYPWTEE